jgi:hypothetical protein
MSLLGCEWDYIELRRPNRSLRVLGEFPQASGDIYDHSTYSNNDRDRRQDNG